MLNASGCSHKTCCAKQLPYIGKSSLKIVRFDILKYLRVIWDPMGVLLLAGGNYEPLGLSGAQWGLTGAHWGSVSHIRGPVARTRAN